MKAFESLRWIAGILLLARAASAAAETPSFVPPPRTVSDITALLDQERPDASVAARRRAMADGSPPANADDLVLSQFFFRRAQARLQLSRCGDGIPDLERAIELKRKHDPDVWGMQNVLVNQLNNNNCSDVARAFRVASEMIATSAGIGANRVIALRRAQIDMLAWGWGDLDQADAILAKAEDIYKAARAVPSNAPYLSNMEANIELARAAIFHVRGQFREAEIAYVKGEAATRDAMEKSRRWPTPPPRQSFKGTSDWAIAMAAMVKGEQGRLVEAEADLRRALLSRLRNVGKYHSSTARNLQRLARQLLLQGRLEEAEKIARITVDIANAIGLPPEAQSSVAMSSNHANVLQLLGRTDEAAKIYAQLEHATRDWKPEARAQRLLTSGRISALLDSGAIEKGIAVAKEAVDHARRLKGEKHSNFGLAKGLLAVGFARAGRNMEALEEFAGAIPLLTSASHEDEDDDRSSSAARDIRVRLIVETYIATLARVRGAVQPGTAASTFQAAEAIRARTVQSAVAAASARMATRDPALADLLRREQDLGKRLAAHFGLLNTVLMLPPAERREGAAEQMRGRIEAMRLERNGLRREIEQRFPDYADLVNPAPASVEDVQRVLRPDEALISFHFGAERSFVWAVPKSGQPVFSEIAAKGAEIDAKIQVLRRALEPNASTIGDVPPFDVDLAHDLYLQLLKPVEQGWRPAKHLIVTTNGSLALLPLSLLPTARFRLEADPRQPFAEYRAVPWLARTHSVVSVPSAAALLTLRKLPKGSPAREAFLGFGDPFFNAQQAVEAARAEPDASQEAATFRSATLRRRSAPKTNTVSSAELGLLPRLPDTADELKSIAAALRAPPDKTIHLGSSANEAVVKRTNLARFRIIAFATHGLVPGDLNGLVEPALALSAPEVAGVDGDGLLTLDEILNLKLDADWVILSACNTATAADAGAEAASGLARAFFYAGTRAVLVTNWSVHSASARELVSDLFKRQAANPAITRSEALREAMLALLDEGGYRERSGNVLFTYAHPLFWAPYTIIGDGAANH